MDLVLLLDNLGAMGIHRIMVEGGGTLIAALIRAGLVDEIFTFIGNIIIGGRDAPTLADGEGFMNESSFTRLGFRMHAESKKVYFFTGLFRNPKEGIYSFQG